MNLKQIYESQNSYYNTGETKAYEHRLKALKDLKKSILLHEEEIIYALHKDLRKPPMETYTTEIAVLIKELNYAIRHLKKWMKPRRVKGDIMTLGGIPKIYSEPYGLSLIIGTWNYPLNLALTPLVGAIAGGNTAIVKPSELAPNTAEVVKKIIYTAFDETYVAAVLGETETAKELLEFDFDKIFFTGSPRVGKYVMEKASRNLSSVTLELGGKSPCIIDKNIDLDKAVQRILFGKLINNGQTCIAPDYLIIEESLKNDFVSKFSEKVGKFYGTNVQDSPDLTRIINEGHFDRLVSYLDNGRILAGGKTDKENLYISPTLMEPYSLDEKIMSEEIFGPILPLVTYKSFEDIKNIIKRNPNPLALYLFSNDKVLTGRVLEDISFGGGTVNDTLFHIVGDHLPFGGKKTSGTGSYHGNQSFKTFTHEKSVLHKHLWLELALKYPPYRDAHKFIKKFMLK